MSYFSNCSDKTPDQSKFRSKSRKKFWTTVLGYVHPDWEGMVARAGSSWSSCIGNQEAERD